MEYLETECNFYTLPLDVIRIISNLLPPRALLTVNKKISTAYNGLWYKEFLEKYYQETYSFNKDVKLSTKWSYKDLYNKYLFEGRIFKVNCDDLQNVFFGCKRKLGSVREALPMEKLDIKGIKFSRLTTRHSNGDGYILGDMVLNFNGDINFYYNCKGVQLISLIDTNVTDIEDNMYIKDNKIYSFKGQLTKNLNHCDCTFTGFLQSFEADSEIIKVLSTKNTIYIISSNSLYIIFDGSITTINKDNKISIIKPEYVTKITFKERIVDINLIIYHISILLQSGKLVLLHKLSNNLKGFTDILFEDVCSFMPNLIFSMAENVKSIENNIINVDDVYYSCSYERALHNDIFKNSHIKVSVLERASNYFINLHNKFNISSLKFTDGYFLINEGQLFIYKKLNEVFKIDYFNFYKIENGVFKEDIIPNTEPILSILKSKSGVFMVIKS